MNISTQLFRLGQTVAAAWRQLRAPWLPLALAGLVFALLAWITQLQEYTRVLIFDLWSHKSAAAATVLALILTVSGLHHACVRRRTEPAWYRALIAFSPVAAFAISTYLAASEIGGTLFATERRVAMVTATIMLLAFIGLVILFSGRPSYESALERLGARAPKIALTLVLLSLLTPFGPQWVIVSVAQAVGPVALVLLFGFVVSVAVTALAVRPPQIWRRVLGAIVAAAFGFSYFGWNDNHSIRTLAARKESRSSDLKPLFAQWYNARKDRSHFETYPVYIVAAAGGGYYAAYHAALVLARLQDQCSNFAQHVFAISSVSGGSLGAGVFTSLVDQLAPKPVEHRCVASSGSRFADAVETYFKNDFLSPILLYALGPDLAQRILPFAINKYDRALGLEYAIEQAWSEVVKAHGFASTVNPLTLPFGARWSPSAAAPGLILNTTRVDTGQRILISPFRILSTDPQWSEAAQTIWQVGLGYDLPTSTAIGLSARFPVVSPAGAFAGTEVDWSLAQHQRRIRLVDGGYFENSGIATAMDLFAVLEEAIREHKLPIALRLIVIGGIEGVFDDFLSRLIYGDRASGGLRQEADEFRALATALKLHNPRNLSAARSGTGELSSPISALLGTRGDHARQSLHRGWLALMSRSRNRDDDDFADIDDLVPLFGLSEANIPFPLSWVVSSPVRQRIALRTSPQGCVDEPFAELFVARRRDQLNADWRVQLMSSYGEDLRFVIERSRAACGIAAVRRALSSEKRTVEGVR